MRELTKLSDEQQAQKFAAYLAVQSIHCSVDEDDGRWVVWIHDDDDRQKAAEYLEEYQQNPDHERYSRAERKVRHVIREADRLQRESAKQTAKLRQRWEGAWYRCYPATYIGIALCVLVALLCTDRNSGENSAWGVSALCNDEDSVLLSKLTLMDGQMAATWQKTLLDQRMATRQEQFSRSGRPEDIIEGLTFVEGQLPQPVFKRLSFLQERRVRVLAGWEGLKAIVQSGELWRPVTPFFIHLNVIHIFMNMMAFRALGMGIEFMRGTRKFLLLCLLVAIPSHLIQLFWDGPAFGGASGVLFGLIGYAWMKGKTKPEDGIGLTQRTITFCLFWLILCMSGALGPIANAAHVGGLLAGMLVGSRHAIRKKLPFLNKA